jgi:hypothetical protein
MCGIVGQIGEPDPRLAEEQVRLKEGWIHGEAVVRLLQKARQAGKAPNRLWYLFVLESWMRHRQQ